MNPSEQSSDQLADLTERITRKTEYYTAFGGFGEVWPCMLQTGAKEIVVAVKVIRLEGAGVNEKALRLELGTWKRLHHANILPLLGTTRGFAPYISMVSPWLENGSLMDYLLEHQDMTLAERLRILQDVTSGLHYLHSVPVVHGDLTTKNVLLNDEKRAVLTDFGLSSMLADQGHSYLQRSRAQPGAIRYCAPELLNPSLSIKPHTRSDVYSFGCVAFRVLSGYEPWADIKRDMFIIIKVADGGTPQRPANSQISDAHWQLIEQCFSPLGATPSRPSTDEILAFLRNELHSEVVIPSTELLNGDDATTSFQGNTTVTMLQSSDLLEMSSTVDTEQPITSPSHDLPSSIRDRRGSPAMGSERTRNPISGLFRRQRTQPSIEREAASDIMIPTNSLKRVHDFAVPPGGHGNTFRCVRRVGLFNNEMLAVKSIKIRNDDEGNIRKAQKAILAEVKRWMFLKHQNLLPVYGTTTGFGSSLPCLVSPWMENGCLTTYLSTRSETLSAREKLKLLSHVAAGLHYLHCNHSIHGNLSSNNVLIDCHHTVRLADYGLSSVISACGDLFQSYHCGAMRWTAPELISDDDEDQISSRYSDIYSFGCIALHIFSGKLPYWWLDDVLCVIYARHKGEDPLGSGTEMGGRYDEFVRHCLSASPADRPTMEKIKSFITKSLSN